MTTKYAIESLAMSRTLSEKCQIINILLAEQKPTLKNLRWIEVFSISEDFPQSEQ